nr:T-complex protein 1 subunit delta [Ipomoea batatas]
MAKVRVEIDVSKHVSEKIWIEIDSDRRGFWHNIVVDVRCLVFDKKVSHASGGLTRVEKDKIDVIQFQIFPPKTHIEHIIVASDYTQMDRILKEERTSTTLIKSCSAVKGSAIEGEKEILVELEEQLLNMRFQSLHQNYRYISSALEYSESVSSGSGSSGQECGNTLSTLSFGTVVIGKAGENCFADVHDLRLLCNWHLQWCFVNAKTDSAYFKLTETVEWNLYNAQLATPTLLRSVKSKQTELFLLKQNFKLYHICSVVNMVHEKAYNEVPDNQISDGNMNVSKTSIVAESVVTEAVKEDTYVEVGTLVAKENSKMISHNTEREVAGDIAMLNHGHCDNAINWAGGLHMVFAIDKLGLTFTLSWAYKLACSSLPGVLESRSINADILGALFSHTPLWAPDSSHNVAHERKLDDFFNHKSSYKVKLKSSVVLDSSSNPRSRPPKLISSQDRVYVGGLEGCSLVLDVDGMSEEGGGRGLLWE